MNDNDKKTENIIEPDKTDNSKDSAGKDTGAESTGNNSKGKKNTGSKSAANKSVANKSAGNKSVGARKNRNNAAGSGRKKSGKKTVSTKKAGNADKAENISKQETKKAADDKEKRKPDIKSAAIQKSEDDKSKEEKRKKIKNSNLRLVKNGDLPVEDTPAKKSPKKGTDTQKETASKKGTDTKKETGSKKGTDTKKETGSKKGTGSKKEAGSKKETFQKKDIAPKKETEKEKVKRKAKKEDYYEDKPGLGEWYIQHRSLVIIGLTVFAAVALLASLYYYFITNYEVTTVYVDGNIHYTNEEVMNMVMNGRYGNNSLYLSMKYKDKGVEGVPFVEKMDVNILAPDTIRINVYEKAIAGYVEYLGQYMYFDKDGIIVESSEVRTKGVPLVTGLDFNYVVMHEPLPVENDGIFKQILSITQLLDKYKLNADKIFFDSVYDMTLYFGGVRVTIGSEDAVDEKLMKLPSILPELEGKSGTLHYMEDGKTISFNEDS